MSVEVLAESVKTVLKLKGVGVKVTLQDSLDFIASVSRVGEVGVITMNRDNYLVVGITMGITMSSQANL